MTGARPKVDARRSATPRQPRTASSTDSPVCGPELVHEPIGEDQAVALIGPLIAELVAHGLATRQLGGAGRHPSVGDVIRR